jgi:cytochrome c-type biogenesis protein CcmE
MQIIRARRLLWIILLLLGSSTVVALILYALRQNINFFYTPTQVITGEAPLQTRIRIGGMVVKNSLEKGPNLEIHFLLTDFKEKVRVEYRGLLPDLFKEGQGVVALGELKNGQIFHADEILAKHDENYMPPEIKELQQAKIGVN